MAESVSRLRNFQKPSHLANQHFFLKKSDFKISKHSKIYFSSQVPMHSWLQSRTVSTLITPLTPLISICKRCYSSLFSVESNSSVDLLSSVTPKAKCSTKASGEVQEMKKLPTGIQSIEKILTQGYIYVDKTDHARRLIEGDSPHYFMSRPRRFGKSLFLDTLREILNGNQNLFEGCTIHKSSYNWQKYPVIYLDFSQVANRNPEEFEASLKRTLQNEAQVNGFSIDVPTVQEGLKALIVGLSSKHKNKVVVLTDEYDKPLVDRLYDIDIANGNRDILQGFFGTLKSLDRELRFTFTTGISKFSQVSLFSGFNNLVDLTMDPEFADVMGYTEEELKKCFGPHMQSISEGRSRLFKEQVTEKDVLEEVREWYNGYRFSASDTHVYNPFSTLNFLKNKKAESFWYSTGTPSFLVDQVRKEPTFVASLSGVVTSKRRLTDITHLNLNTSALPALMFQTGYLTIESYNQEEDSYRLGFPNREVKEAFYGSLIEEFGIDSKDITRVSQNLRNSLGRYNMQSFVDIINSHFAKISYNTRSQLNEGSFQSNLFLMLQLSGIHSLNELSTNIGRIDLVSETQKSVYIFELKLDKDANQAIEQAKKKNYKERYLNQGKEILIVGINFSSKSRNISDWKAILHSQSGEVIKEISPS